MLQEWNSPFRHPYLVFALSLFVMLLANQIGLYFRKRRLNLEEDAPQDLEIIVGATLTLLGLIIGFSFSMAISRYDQRKNYEEAEANAIGTEYVRADLLPAADANRIRALLRGYLEQRVLFYENRDEHLLQQIDTSTSQLQTQLWSAVKAPSAMQPTPVTALVVSGMNDVLNSQGYTQAAWWNQIPVGAWGLMLSIAICSNLLVAYGAGGAKAGAIRVLVLPFVLAIAFFFIADIDSPRRGVIRVRPQNLISVAQSMTGR
jgi:hypothetical protein